MKRSRCSEGQIMGILKEHGAGLPAAELCRKHGISEATLHNWRSKYGGMEVSDARQRRALEEENRKMKKLLAESTLDVATLKEMLAKKLLTPRSRRVAVGWAIAERRYTQRRARRLVGLHPKRPTGVSRSGRMTARSGPRLRELAAVRRRFGYRRLHILLRREGIMLNHKKFYRLYREERLMVREHGGWKRALGTRAPLTVPQEPNSLDFVADTLAHGRRFRILTVVDDLTRECLAAVVDTSLSGRRVIRELDRIGALRELSRDGCQRQRQRTDLECDVALAAGARHRMALHRTRQTDAERLHRILQWPAQGRVPQRDRVHHLEGGHPDHRSLAYRLQYHPAAHEPRRAHTGHRPRLQPAPPRGIT